MLTCSALDDLAGCRLHFKCENLQKVGAFKARGACNAVFSLSDEQAAEIREIRANGGSREDVRAVLTDEQRVLMDEHRANRQGRRDGKGGNRRSPDGRNAGDAVGEAGEPAAG